MLYTLTCCVKGCSFISYGWLGFHGEWWDEAPPSDGLDGVLETWRGDVSTDFIQFYHFKRFWKKKWRTKCYRFITVLQVQIMNFTKRTNARLCPNRKHTIKEGKEKGSKMRRWDREREEGKERIGRKGAQSSAAILQ